MQTVANKSETMRYIEQFKIKVQKKFGQNFIIDPSIVKKIASESDIKPETTVIEIGPGLGALTQQLAMYAKKVIAYEIDPQMVQVLSSWIDRKKIEVIQQDFLSVDLEALNLKDVVICSNVPYYITTPIIFKCLESQSSFRQMTLMMQKEMAERLAAKVNSKDYNALSVLMELFFTRQLIMNVKAQCFYPRPQVDSCVLALKRNQRKVEDYREFIQFVKLCFTQRRKTLVNNLKPLAKDVVKALQVCGLDEQVRAQALRLEDFLKLYEVLYEA